MNNCILSAPELSRSMMDNGPSIQHADTNDNHQLELDIIKIQAAGKQAEALCCKLLSQTNTDSADIKSKGYRLLRCEASLDMTQLSI
jgi:hypothetical protein